MQPLLAVYPELWQEVSQSVGCMTVTHLVCLSSLTGTEKPVYDHLLGEKVGECMVRL